MDEAIDQRTSELAAIGRALNKIQGTAHCHLQVHKMMSEEMFPGSSLSNRPM